RNVLGALEIADDEVLVFLGAGSQGEAAVAHHDAGDAVIAGRGPERIPEDLRVHVRVAVDEARRDDVAFGVDHLARALTNTPDGGDAAVPHSDIGPIPRKPGSIDDRAVLDYQVVRHSRLSSVGVSDTLRFRIVRFRIDRLALAEAPLRLVLPLETRLSGGTASARTTAGPVPGRRSGPTSSRGRSVRSSS